MPKLAELGIMRGKRAMAKAANRKAILEAARAVFARIGYEACSIRDIIRETSLASGTFYNYFKSKEEVYEAIADDSVSRFRPLLAKVREEADGLESYMHAAFGAYFHFLASENDQAIAANMPHISLIGVRIDTPEMQSISDEIRSDLEVVLLKNGHSHVDTDYLSAAAIGLAREMGDHMLQRRPVDPDYTATFATNLMMNGLSRLATRSS